MKGRHCHNLPEQALTTPELCLQLLLLKGEDIVLSFNGLFCLALYDSRDQRLVLISDRYGFRPVYYRARQDSFLFGSELKALCAVDQGSRKIDEVGTAELFCYGTHFRERTWMEDCLRLPPSTILTIGKTGLHSRTYWTYRYRESAPTLDQQTHFTVFGTLLDRAVERCMKGSRRLGIFLSGGYDNRCRSASLRKHYLSLPALPFG